MLQTSGKNPHITEETLKELLRKRFNETDFDKVKADIEPFLQNSSDLRLYRKEIFLQTLD